MADREQVIKGFECCHVMVHNLGPDKSSCGICPYKDVQTEEQIDLGGIECIAVLHDDALALLKEQDLDIEALKNTIQGMVEGQAIIAGDRRVDVVRCKSCKHWSAERINDYNKCKRWINVGVKNFATMGDWFCADGERRETDG